nr:immunoglobulin heavy chain junction region [Mus musculus]
CARRAYYSYYFDYW